MPSVVSDRQREHAAMLEVIQAAGVAERLDEATKRLGSRLDRSDTDEGMERVQTRLNTAFLEALVYVARSEGWDPSRITERPTRR